ncbi:DoxX family protein [Algoriphagus sp. H41]|uniref:DoxX family protein n=1 Tax=Algoriphagus oliviformis TaxID=2811231 RepID=A0ABS3C2X1_9BACT|nr:DoxX family protein [Algoriphagus oliviformis]MBN7811230.1 DoxX family protein [Algoriphagus oliviformis]
MENPNHKFIKLFLRVALAAGFLSAVADRFGMWPSEVSVWGDWGNFVAYTGLINPWFPESLVPSLAAIATAAEVLFAICLLLGFKTELFAKLSGVLLLIFGLSMTFSTGIKGAFDYSVFAAAGAAFALSAWGGKAWELDSLLAADRT